MPHTPVSGPNCHPVESLAFSRPTFPRSCVALQIYSSASSFDFPFGLPKTQILAEKASSYPFSSSSSRFHILPPTRNSLQTASFNPPSSPNFLQRGSTLKSTYPCFAPHPPGQETFFFHYYLAAYPSHASTKRPAQASRCGLPCSFYGNSRMKYA